MALTYEADGAEIQQVTEGLFCITQGLEDAEELRFVIIKSALRHWVCGEKNFAHDLAPSTCLSVCDKDS